MSKRYVPVNFIGRIFSLAGFITLSFLKADSSTGEWVGFQIIAGIGTGVIVSGSSFLASSLAFSLRVQLAGTVFAILAPIPVQHTASALAFLAFLRAFAQVQYAFYVRRNFTNSSTA